MTYRDPNLWPGTGRTKTLRYNVEKAILEVLNDHARGHTAEDAKDMLHQFVTDDTGSAAYIAFNVNMAGEVNDILQRIGYDAREIGHSNLRVEFS